jgi:hypothetical protein
MTHTPNPFRVQCSFDDLPRVLTCARTLGWNWPTPSALTSQSQTASLPCTQGSLASPFLNQGRLALGFEANFLTLTGLEFIQPVCFAFLVAEKVQTYIFNIFSLHLDFERHDLKGHMRTRTYGIVSADFYLNPAGGMRQSCRILSCQAQLWRQIVLIIATDGPVKCHQ